MAEAIGYRPGRSSLGEIDGRSSSLSRITSAQSNASARSTDDLTSPNERVLQSPDLRDLESPAGSDEELDDNEDEAEEMQESVVRPEDEAALLAYERAQKVFEEEREEAEARAVREKERAERSASRGGTRSRSRGRKDDGNEEGGGAAVLGLLAQLDRGIK